MEQIGIDNLKRVLLFGLNFQKGVVAAKADGVVNWMDVGHLFPIIQSASAAFNGVNKLKGEILDIDDGEQSELISITRDFYADLTDDQAKVLIEETVNFVIDGVQLGLRWSQLDKGVSAENIS